MCSFDNSQLIIDRFEAFRFAGESHMRMCAAAVDAKWGGAEGVDKLPDRATKVKNIQAAVCGALDSYLQACSPCNGFRKF